MKWIRWGGLFVFILLVAVIGGSWMFLVDGVVKGLIEEQGSELVGAKVDLLVADLSLLPAGLILKDLAVTDPENPMTNAVEISKIALSLDGFQLFRQKVIVEEMTIDGVRLGTPRKTSGAISKKGTTPHSDHEGTTSPTNNFVMPSFDIPNVDEILKQENLETLQIIETIKTDMEQEQSQWEDRLKSLPGKEALAEYHKRIESIKGATKEGVGGILGGVEEIQAVKTDLERDIRAIKSAKAELLDKITTLKSRVDQVIEAPQADVRRIQEKYSLSPQGLANLGGTLLGQQLGGRIRQALMWYNKLKPIVERVKESQGGEGGPEIVKPLRGKGVDVRFPERNPLPDLLIRLANVSLNLKLGDLSGHIENITPDQDILGKPLTFDFIGEKLTTLQAIQVKGNLNHINAENPNDRINLRAEGYHLYNLALSKQEEWPVSLNKGLANMNVRAELQGKALSANVKGNLNNLSISAGKTSDTNPLTQSLSSSLSDVNSFSFNAKVKGTVDEYQIDLNSDLDRIMKQAAGKLVQNLSTKFTKQLSRAIQAKVKGPIQDLKQRFGTFNGIRDNLTNRLTQSNNLLSSLLKQKMVPKTLPGGLKLPF